MTAKEWNKSKNTFKKVYNNVRNAHPDWSNQRVYMAVKNKFSSKKNVKAEPAEQPVIVLHKDLMTNDTVTLDIYTDDADMSKVFELNNISYSVSCPNRYVIDKKDLANIIMLTQAMQANVNVILTIHNGIGFATDEDMVVVQYALHDTDINYSVYDEDVFINFKDIDTAVTAISEAGLYAELI